MCYWSNDVEMGKKMMFWWAKQLLKVYPGPRFLFLKWFAIGWVFFFCLERIQKCSFKTSKHGCFYNANTFQINPCHYALLSTNHGLWGAALGALAVATVASEIALWVIILSK